MMHHGVTCWSCISTFINILQVRNTCKTKTSDSRMLPKAHWFLCINFLLYLLIKRHPGTSLGKATNCDPQVHNHVYQPGLNCPYIVHWIFCNSLLLFYLVCLNFSFLCTGLIGGLFQSVFQCSFLCMMNWESISLDIQKVSWLLCNALCIAGKLSDGLPL